MRLHTDVLDHGKVYDIIGDLTKQGKITGVWAEHMWHGSRSRAHGFDLRLTADPRKGRRRFTNSGYAGATDGEYAATWDEWGIILAALYEADPNMTGDYYADAEHYHWSTGNRFRDGGPAETHDTHRWAYKGHHLTGDGYPVSECKCGSLRRYVGKHDRGGFERLFGRKWGERIAVTA